MAATSVLMMTTHSFFNAALSRLPSPEVYLSAFAVAKSLLHIFESPIMMVRQAVSTLVKDSQSYFKVKNFFLVLTLITVGILALVSFTGISEWLFDKVIGVEGRVLKESVLMFSVFIFFPVVASLRNFMQGIAVKLNRTPLFTVATLFRMVYVFILVLLVEWLSFLPGAVFGGLMFFTAVGMEGLVIFLGVKIAEKDIPGQLDKISVKKNTPAKKLNHHYIFRFFWPLIITSIIHTAAAPLVNMGMARSLRPEIAISAYTVAWNLGILILSPSFMFHQQVINYFDKNKQDYTRSLRKFGTYMGLIMILFLGALAYSDLGYYIMKNWIGATEKIAFLAVDVLQLMIFMPPIVLGREFYWGILMKEGQTRSVSKGKGANIIALILSIIILLIVAPSNPAIIGALAIIMAEGTEVFYLGYTVHRKNLV